MMSTEELLEQVKQAAKDAGKIMLGASDIREATTQKEGHSNFVTEYDKKVQEFLYKRLGEILPEAAFMGEEEGEGIFKEEYKTGYLYVIDPIDGTTNFITGYYPAVTSIGLMKDGKPYLGVVYDPFGDNLFWAVKGMGAYHNGKRIHSSKKPLAESVVAIGTTPYYPELFDKSLDLAKEYLKRCMDIRRSGTAAWDLCLVASGIAGLCYELVLCLWDYAAGAVILEEAGGKLTDEKGNELRYDGNSAVIAVSEGVAKEEYLFTK